MRRNEPDGALFAIDRVHDCGGSDRDPDCLWRMKGVELTRDLLMEAGGWKEMKAAREMHRGGLVCEASYANGSLEGVVLIGGQRKKVRMEIVSSTHMENKCSCLMARREGRVCAHAIAVGLEVIDPGKRPDESPPEEEVDQLEQRWPEITEEFQEEAYALECRVMLPLKVADSWERGQLLVVFGTEYEGEEHLLASWSQEYVLQVGEEDSRLLEILRRLFPEEPPGAVNISREQFLELLDGLAGHPRVSFGKRDAATISCRQVRLSLGVQQERLQAQWPTGLIPLVEGGDAWGLNGETRTFYPVASGVPESWEGVLGSGVLQGPLEASSFLDALRHWFEIEEGLIRALPQAAMPEVEVVFEGSLNHVEGRMSFLYGDNRRPAGVKEGALFSVDNEERVLASPDHERLAEDALRQWGFEGPGKKGEFLLRDSQAILRFHAHGLQCLDPEWTVVRGERFSEFAREIVPIKPVFEVSGASENWLEVELNYEAGDGTRLKREEVQRLLNTGRADRVLGGGRVAVLDPGQVDEVSETLADCDPRQALPGVFRVDAKQAAYLRQSAIDLGLAGGEQMPGLEKDEGELDLGPLGEVLRPYQKEGVEWLWRLAELQMGGILADDMGLGKTLQTLAFLAVRGGPSLVVCPSSLIDNWMEEAGRFVPDLEVVAIEGPKRMEVLAENPGADLLVTSYALLRIDIDLYRDRDFKVVILDEAQHIKNPDAQVSRAAFRLPGIHRFALTGTPMENSVSDLWSIMNFVMPGYLGERGRFADRFEKPLARGDAPGLQRRLSRRLKPVVLRRLKEEVARDLPEKIEQVRYCKLSDSQRQVYQTILDEGRSMISSAEGGQRRMLALTTLLRLRQACCDLRLLNLPDLGEEEGSVKMKELQVLLEEAVGGGHRVLVFSQFVQMLQGTVPLLAEKGFEFCYLDGKTRNRGEVVRRFQESSIPVFLISLKAGGVGLNLTGADTVIHLDPWWNPAVEAQATDRAHRIGQERVVTSYKLITRDTVEEKILSLQERKRELIASTLGSGVPGPGMGLDEDEIFELFG